MTGDTTMPEVRLRAAVDEDSEGLIRLIAAVFAEYPGCVLDVDREEPCLRSPATSFDRFWVLEIERDVVGCAALVLCSTGDGGGGPTAEVKKVYVSRVLRRRGCGRLLMQKVEESAESLGAAAIELWTDTRFVEAHAFYEGLGYARTGRQRDLHDLSNTTEVHYRKLLRSAGKP